MHLQDGIGRGGYRVLAFVFFAVGALGLAMAAIALTPTGFFEWLGLALAAVAIATLTGLILATLGPMAFAAAPARMAPSGAPDSGVVPLPTPEPPMDADPSADLGFEYPEVEPLAPAEEQAALAPVYAPASPPKPSRPLATPPAMARPQQRSAPPSGKANPGDGSGWPERKGPAGVTRRQAAERDAPREPPGPDFEADGRPAGRREAPVIMARTVASAEATGIPEGTGVGKCGNCGVLLLAPKKRPIRLQCPRCERVHTLA